MTARSLQAVLRSLADAAPPAGDAELLARFLAGDEDAFGELVRRHGRLVWAVCRHLTGSDAEADDAFQATFLVLLKNAGKVRDAARLSAWLHGVAYKVCAKSRQSAKRRTARERATAAPERNGHAVADSAWDRALAAVHEEVAKLPESLRVPFVLCCLEGKGVTEAAGQLGWKLGTFSGRLTRAKDALLARLDARGLTLGVVVGLGLTAPPASAIAKAAALAQVGFVVPKSVLQLTQGVIGMSMKSVKLLAAAVIVTCGLGLGLGKGWVATAGAQTNNPQPPAKAKPEDELKRLQAELEALRAAEAANRQTLEAQKEALRARDLLQEAARRQAVEAERAALDALAAAGQKDRVEQPSAKTSKWEYDFVLVSEMTQNGFVKFLQERETRGWEYNGLTKYRLDGKMADIWVFRRPAKGTVSQTLLGEYNRKLAAEEKRRADEEVAKAADIAKLKGAEGAGARTEARAIEADIAKLQARLAELNRGKPAQSRVVIPKADLPLDAAELADVLRKLAGERFRGSNYTFTPTDTGLAIHGDKVVIDWAAAVIKKLGEK